MVVFRYLGIFKFNQNLKIMLRTLFIAAILIAFSTESYSQGELYNDLYKQSGNEWNLELQFTPFSSTPFSQVGIRGRKFIDSRNAWRSTLFLDYSSDSDYNLIGDEELRICSYDFNINVSAGRERHFEGTNRLSPYIGGDVLLGYGTSGSKEEILLGDDTEELESCQAVFRWGLGLVGGFDFYFAKDFYVGGELGVGLVSQHWGTEKVDYVDKGGEIDTEEIPGGSSFDFGANVLTSIRLGYLFRANAERE